MPIEIEAKIEALAAQATDWPVFGREAVDGSVVNWRGFWADCVGAGLLGLNVPEEFGGSLQSTSTVVHAMAALGRVCLDNALPMGLNSQIWTVQEPLLAFGTDAQKARYLPALVSGEQIAAFAMTEESAGSDAMNLTTRAERSEDGYILNGEKCFIGLVTECDVVLVFASTAPERKSWGLSVFIVEKGDIGFVQGPEQSKIGLTTMPMGQMRLENCFVPENRRLGPEGAGASIFQATMDLERSFLFATQVGAMERQLLEATAYAKSREVFGQPIAQFQSVSNRIADMAVRLETCQLMQQKAAGMKDAGTLNTLQAAMTKLHISEAFLASSLDAMRIHGGIGYLAGSQAGEDMKDSLGGVIYSGTSDIQRNVIARLQGAKMR